MQIRGKVRRRLQLEDLQILEITDQSERIVHDILDCHRLADDLRDLVLLGERGILRLDRRQHLLESPLCLLFGKCRREVLADQDRIVIYHIDVSVYIIIVVVLFIRMLVRLFPGVHQQVVHQIAALVHRIVEGCQILFQKYLRELLICAVLIFLRHDGIFYDTVVDDHRLELFYRLGNQRDHSIRRNTAIISLCQAAVQICAGAILQIDQIRLVDHRVRHFRSRYHIHLYPELIGRIILLAQRIEHILLQPVVAAAAPHIYRSVPQFHIVDHRRIHPCAVVRSGELVLSCPCSRIDKSIFRCPCV